jgi:hypothetical protein
MFLYWCVVILCPLSSRYQSGITLKFHYILSRVFFWFGASVIDLCIPVVGEKSNRLHPLNAGAILLSNY